MFDLEQSITQWRQQMLTAGIKTPVPLEELEIHLREEIERQTKWGRSEAEAFQSAVQIIGQAHAVQNEFEKVEAVKKAPQEKFLQIMLLIIMSVVPLFLGGLVLFKNGSGSQLTSSEQMSCLAALATFSLLGWGGRLSGGIFPAIRTQRIRNPIVIASGVLVIIWLIAFTMLILPHCDFTTGQLLVAVAWGFFTPIGSLSGLIWGIETAAWKNPRPAAE